MYEVKKKKQKNKTLKNRNVVGFTSICFCNFNASVKKFYFKKFLKNDL